VGVEGGVTVLNVVVVGLDAVVAVVSDVNAANQENISQNTSFAAASITSIYHSAARRHTNRRSDAHAHTHNNRTKT